MRKFLSRIAVSAIIGCASVSAFADTSAVQRVVYVNGIQNTDDDAREVKRKISCIHHGWCGFALDST